MRYGAIVRLLQQCKACTIETFINATPLIINSPSKKKKYNCINGYIRMLHRWNFLHYYVSDSTQIGKNVYHTMIKNMSYKSIIPYGVGAKCAKHETSNTMKKTENGTAEISYDRIYTQRNLVSKGESCVRTDRYTNTSAYMDSHYDFSSAGE